MTIPAQHRSLFINDQSIMSIILERGYFAPKPRLKACLDRNLQFSLSRVECLLCHPHSYTAAVCFSWDFTLWLLGMIGMQQKNSRDESRFEFKTEMCSVSWQTNANKAVMGTSAPMLRNDKIANLSIYPGFTCCKHRGRR